MKIKHLLFTVFTGLLAVVLSIACSKSSGDVEVKEAITDEFTPERVGELHNIFLQRAMDEYLPTAWQKVTTRSGDEIDVLNVSGLVDFMALQPEVCHTADYNTLGEIKELFLGFEPDGERQYSQDDFIEYLEGKVVEKFGVSWQEILTGDSEAMTRSVCSTEMLNNARQYGLNVYKHSLPFWSQKHGLTRSGEEVSPGDFNPDDFAPGAGIGWRDALADILGGLIGATVGGGYGAAIGSPGASLLNSAIEEMNPGPINYESWQTNPKWC